MLDTETILLIGDSPYLETIQDKLFYLVDKYPSMGINNIVKKYKVQRHVFQDMPFCTLTNAYPEITTIAPKIYGDLIRKKKKELYESFTFNFKINTPEDICTGEKLAWCGFTHDYAISYCIMKEFKNIILIGAADFTKGKHFMTEDDFNPSEKLALQSKRFIEEICSKRTNIYTCNENSWLEIPRININNLL